METEVTGSEGTTTETTQTTETEAAAATTDAAAASTAAAAGTSTAATTAAAEIPQYMPNFKFKVKDKELEFDEFVRPVIKTKDVEEKLRDLYAKAHGLDEVKTARDSFKTKAQDLEEKYTKIDTSLKQLGKFVQKKDFRTFFDALSIPKQDILNYAMEELKIQELPAEQQAAIEAQRQRDLELEHSTLTNQSLQQQMQQLVTQQATFELTQALATPDVSSAISAFDAKVGQAGAFKAEVIRRGQYYEAVHKISPPASQLVQEVLTLIGVQAQTQTGEMGTSPSNAQQGYANQQQKPVIPTFSGGSSKSPAKKVMTSIEDIRKARQNANA